MNLKKPLKIAYIVRKYSTSGGTERHIYTISKKLSELGYDVTIFCAKKEVFPPDKNIKIKKIFSDFPSRLIKTYLFYYFTKKIDISQFDIVQGAAKVVNHHIYRAGGGFHKLYLRFQKKREKLSIYDKVVMKIENEIFNPLNTKYVIAVSNFVAYEIEKEFNYPKNRIAVFHNSVDTEFFKPMREKKKENILKCLFVANDYKLKGLDKIIKVLPFFTNIKLSVVGNDNKTDFVNLAEKLNVLKKIKFHGDKRGKELLKIYQNSDLLIHPTDFDPFSNVCLEALACGLPVITTKINGASEIIENFKDGIVIEKSDDLRALKDGIKFFFNKENLQKSSENAVKKAKNYSLDKYIKRLIEFYNEIKR